MISDVLSELSDDLSEAIESIEYYQRKALYADWYVISDVLSELSHDLSEAIERIEHYQREPVYADWYDDLKEEIDAVKFLADQLRKKLDTTPDLAAQLNRGKYLHR
jgi:hypothetical protein